MGANAAVGIGCGFQVFGGDVMIGGWRSLDAGD